MPPSGGVITATTGNSSSEPQRAQKPPVGGWWSSTNRMSASIPDAVCRHHPVVFAHPAELEPDAAAVLAVDIPHHADADTHRGIQLIGRDRRQEQLHLEMLAVLARVDPQVGTFLVAAPRGKRVQRARDLNPSVHFASSQVAPTPVSMSSGGSSG